jgi:hypothetical protein
MFTVNHHDMAFGLERVVEERRQAAQRSLGREARAANSAPASRFDRVLASAGNWLAVQGRRLEDRYGEVEKPIAITDTHRAGTR